MPRQFQMSRAIQPPTSSTGHHLMFPSIQFPTSSPQASYSPHRRPFVDSESPTTASSPQTIAKRFRLNRQSTNVKTKLGSRDKPKLLPVGAHSFAVNDSVVRTATNQNGEKRLRYQNRTVAASDGKNTKENDRDALLHKLDVESIDSEPTADQSSRNNKINKPYMTSRLANKGAAEENRNRKLLRRQSKKKLSELIRSADFLSNNVAVLAATSALRSEEKYSVFKSNQPKADSMDDSGVALVATNNEDIVDDTRWGQNTEDRVEQLLSDAQMHYAAGKTHNVIFFTELR